MEKEIKVYTLPTWPHCKTAKEYLSQKGFAYQEIDVGKDKEAAKEMMKISNSRSVPVIVIEKEVIVGFDTARIDTVLSNWGIEE